MARRPHSSVWRGAALLVSFPSFAAAGAAVAKACATRSAVAPVLMQQGLKHYRHVASGTSEPASPASRARADRGEVASAVLNISVATKEAEPAFLDLGAKAAAFAPLRHGLVTSERLGPASPQAWATHGAEVGAADRAAMAALDLVATGSREERPSAKLREFGIIVFLGLLVCAPLVVPALATERSAYSAVLSVQFVFTGYQILAKVALSGKDVDPVAFALIRALGTSVSLLLIAAFTVPSHSWRPRGNHKWHFLLLGVSMASNILGLIFALQFTTSAIVAMLQVLRPIFAGMLSRIMGIERFTVQKLCGMVVCLAGAGMITHAGSQLGAYRVAPGSAYGLGFVCLHSVGQSSYVIQQPQLLEAGYSPAVINGYAFLIASALIAALLPFPCHSGIWYERTVFFWEMTLYSILLVGAYAYAVMGWAAKRVGGTTVMLFMLFQAILTVCAGRAFLGEQIHSIQALGGAVIMAGIVIFVSGSANLTDESESKPILKI